MTEFSEIQHLSLEKEGTKRLIKKRNQVCKKSEKAC